MMADDAGPRRLRTRTGWWASFSNSCLAPVPIPCPAA